MDNLTPEARGKGGRFQNGQTHVPWKSIKGGTRRIILHTVIP